MESRRLQRAAYERRRRERRRRLTLRWFVLVGCLVVIVFLFLILTDSCQGSTRAGFAEEQVASLSPSMGCSAGWPEGWPAGWSAGEPAGCSLGGEVAL